MIRDERNTMGMETARRLGRRVESDSPPGLGNVARVFDYSIKA